MCDTSALFKCCGIYLCLYDYDRHFKNKADHINFEQIHLKLDDIDLKKLKQELLKRISLLKNAKKEIISNSESLIKSILTLQESMIQKLKSIINRYNQLLNLEYFNTQDKNEIQNIIDKNMTIKFHDFKTLAEELKFCYQFELNETEIEIDASAKKIENYKKFLNLYNGGFRCVTISCDQKILITGGSDATVRVWSIFDKE